MWKEKCEGLNEFLREEPDGNSRLEQPQRLVEVINNLGCWFAIGKVSSSLVRAEGWVANF